MKQKIFFTIAILSLLSLAVFVVAEMNGMDQSGNTVQFDVNLELSEGWNLIPAMCNSGVDEINALNIQTLFVYDNEEKKYFNVYHDKKFYNEDFLGKYEEHFCSSSWWAYVKQDISVNYKTDHIPLTTQKIIARGWNFLIITPEMTGDINALSSEEEDKYTLNAMKGNCDWTKVYTYAKDGGEMKWMDLLNNPNFMDSEPLDEDLSGMGLLIKVNGDCQLSSPGASTGGTTPPELP